METLKFWVCKCHVTYCSLFRCNYYSIPLSFFRKISTNFIADTNLTYDRESLMKWADSPLAKQLPTHWSREWKKVQDENKIKWLRVTVWSSNIVLELLLVEEKFEFSNSQQPYESQSV